MTSLDALVDQLRSIPQPTSDFTGQTIIVTGSNRGLGFEAAQHFVRLNAKQVILAVRNIGNGEAAKASIELATKRKGVIEVYPLDMLDYQSIKDFTLKCSSLDRLDVLVANAGVLRNTYEESEGTEVSVKVNVIGTFLLAIGLLPKMRQSGLDTGHTATVVVTSSVLHQDAKFAERHQPQIFHALNKDNKSYIADRYNTSKLLEVFLVRSITAAMKEGPHATQPVIWNAVNPGLCHSDLTDELTGLASVVAATAKTLIARTGEVGSRTIVHSAAAGDESHGQYMSNCSVRKPSKFVRSKEGQNAEQRVHLELMDILENIQPGVTSNI